MLERFDRQYTPPIAATSVKDDKDVTPDDFAHYNVVLFGASAAIAGSPNSTVNCRYAGAKKPWHSAAGVSPAADAVPALIYPSPSSPDRYVVINSGLTAAWADWAGDFPTPLRRLRHLQGQGRLRRPGSGLRRLVRRLGKSVL
jgi:hypothetical protein